jgi:hypothetical protein
VLHILLAFTSPPQIPSFDVLLDTNSHIWVTETRRRTLLELVQRRTQPVCEKAPFRLRPLVVLCNSVSGNLQQLVEMVLERLFSNWEWTGNILWSLFIQMKKVVCEGHEKSSTRCLIRYWDRRLVSHKSGPCSTSRCGRKPHERLLFPWCSL